MRDGLYRLEVEGVGCRWEILKIEGLWGEVMHPQRRGFRELMHLYKFGKCYCSSVTAHSIHGDNDFLPDMIDNMIFCSNCRTLLRHTQKKNISPASSADAKHLL